VQAQFQLSVVAGLGTFEANEHGRSGQVSKVEPTAAAARKKNLIFVVVNRGPSLGDSPA
jgi:hypothetical protein